MSAVTHFDVLAGGNLLSNLLRGCAKLITQQAERLFDDPELNLTHCIALMLIELGVATTPGELADSLGHNAGATTRTIDQLKRWGLVKRRRDIRDRRVVTLTVTPQGSWKARESRRMLAEFNQRVLEAFDVSEVELLLILLRRLMTALETANSA